MCHKFDKLVGPGSGISYANLIEKSPGFATVLFHGTLWLLAGESTLPGLFSTNIGKCRHIMGPYIYPICTLLPT